MKTGYLKGARQPIMLPKSQADIVTTTNNPVSTQQYTVFPATNNPEIYTIRSAVTWAVTQPNPMVLRVNLDGQVITFTQNNPVSGTAYYPWLIPYETPANQAMTTDADVYARTTARIFKCRKISITLAVTWAVTQPNPLVCTIKWCKW